MLITDLIVKVFQNFPKTYITTFMQKTDITRSLCQNCLCYVSSIAHIQLKSNIEILKKVYVFWNNSLLYNIPNSAKKCNSIFCIIYIDICSSYYNSIFIRNT